MLTRCLPLQEEGDTREIRWHIDSLPQHSSSGLDRLVFNQDSTPDVITAVAASDSMLLVARASGTIVRYRCVRSGSASHCQSCHATWPATLIFPRCSMPRIAKEGKYTLKCRPQTMAINCNSTKFAVIDMNAVLYLYSPPPFLHHSLP